MLFRSANYVCHHHLERARNEGAAQAVTATRERESLVPRAEAAEAGPYDGPDIRTAAANVEAARMAVAEARALAGGQYE